MRPIVKVVLPLAVLLSGAAAALAPSAAGAAPIPPTAPYPAPPANAPQCRPENRAVAAAQAEYDPAVRTYTRAKRVWDEGGGIAYQDVQKAELALHKAGIELNKKKYAEATCRFKGTPTATVCDTLGLQLNEVIDELAIRLRVEQVSNELWRQAYDAYWSSAGSADDLDKAAAAAGVAKAERERVEAVIQRTRGLLIALALAGVPCPDAERPAPPAATATPSASPTATATATATATPTATPTVSAPATVTSAAPATTSTSITFQARWRDTQ
jgi:hypothetical protein